MLSRVADSLYWMSRYLERAEHIARVLDVNLNQMLDQAPAAAERRWERMLTSLGMSLPEDRAPKASTITEWVTFDTANRSSIVSCVGAARENLRQVREQISSEMWEQLNRLYLDVRDQQMSDIWEGDSYVFFKTVKEGAHLFQGITDGILGRGEGWQFIQAGRFIERAGATATLLDVHFSPFLEAQQSPETIDYEYIEWVTLLKSCTAFEAYSSAYTAELRPERVAEFLLLNADFPRSVRFSAGALQGALHTIARASGARNAGRAERLTGRLRATLDYAQIDEVMGGSMRGFLDDIQRQCAQIHAMIHETYIVYPVDAALA